MSMSERIEYLRDQLSNVDPGAQPDGLLSTIVEQLTDLGVDAVELERRLDMAELSLCDPEGTDPADVPPAPPLPIGEQVVARAVEAWDLDVREPKRGRLRGAEIIDGYIRGAEGLSWGSADRDRLGEPVPYTKNNQFHWCGAFAAWAWGPWVKPRLRHKHFASTFWLYKWSKGTPRWIPLDDLQPGDVLIVGNRKRKRNRSPWWGAHIALVERVEGDTIYTIEGNAKGRMPDGSRDEGVVRCERPIRHTPGLTAYYAMFAVRPLPEDLEE